MHEHIQESLLSGSSLCSRPSPRRTQAIMKENKGKFCLLFSLVFAGFRKGLSTENLLFRREGMAD